MTERQRLYALQVNQLYNRLHVGIIATLLNALILVFILRELIPLSVLTLWFSALFFISFLRCLLYYQYKRSSQAPADVVRWEMWFLAGLAFSGICWGSAGIFLFPIESVTHQMFIAFVLGGMAAGTAGTYSVRIITFPAFSLPTLLPIIIRFFLIADDIHFAMGAMVLLFGILMYLNAKRINSVTISSLKLQFENKDLVKHLSVEKVRVEKLNEDYLFEINERKQAEDALKKAHNELERRVKERTAELSNTNERLKQEIETRKGKEQALRESEEKYRELIDNTPDLFYRTDMEGRITFISPSVQKLSGYTMNEAIGMMMAKEVYAYSEEREIFLAKLLKDGYVKNFEAKLKRKDGTIWWASTNAHCLKDKAGNIQGVEGITRDVTDVKRTEEKLRETQERLFRSKKMESLGLLAGGVAHDLNNVLSGIVSYPELLLLDLPEDSKLRKPIETIQESGYRAKAIVQDLLTVARGVATTKEVLNINNLVSDYLNSPEYKKLKQYYPTVTIKTIIDSDLFNIRGSVIHIRKILMNLVSNALEAVEGSGTVTISTINRYVDRPLRGYDNVRIGEYAVLTVSDDGTGITSYDLERIFEPFYTKRVMGKSGTGLGLAIVWNVVQDHKGYIDVKSDENGTTFELYFPITRNEISDEDFFIPIENYKGNGETILVIDDEESQREISCNILDGLGYKTKTASSGEEAVEYLKENRVDLVLLDMIMDPGINGRETYERIIEIHPNQKAIIVSGFVETDEVIKTQTLGAGQHIDKPFTLEKIGFAIKKELEK
ncbi:two component system sensor histidine kinase, hybrid [Desulfosarcina variabilis str. Montpellier]|uniref:hybrid sensor histidine kinase/response regulator n=1 Tax=Desulfosarcina variabilis TaxID=2300 RepID=UPI003AFA093B